ncbi:MAG: M48 family metalloprotease [Kofleriaceae bacterium]
MAAVTWAGCATDDPAEDDTGGGKGDRGETCEDVQYGDGTCQVGLECGIPDIDCFQTFATDAEAAAWITGRDGLTALPETDALHVRARALTDRAWAAYAAVNHVGKLADARVSVVVLQNDVINAWVTGATDETKVALSVHFHSAILAPELGDEEILGVVFHELAHITKLHVLPEVHAQTMRYYLADGAEPIGAFQTEDTRVRPHVEAWVNMAAFAGPYTRPELSDMPFGGNVGALFTWMMESLESACPAQVAAVRTIQSELAANVSWLDDDVVANAQHKVRIDTALDLLGACSRTNGPVSIAQLTLGATDWTEYLRSAVPVDEQWLLDESDGVTALQILAGERREELRAAALTFQREVGAPWTAARYFSTEEEADDLSVRVTKAQKFADPGVSTLMRRMMDDKGPCDGALASGNVPYGIRLDDSHHGTCWRIAHARQMAASGDSSARRVTVETARGVWTPTRPSDGKPMY